MMMHEKTLPANIEAEQAVLGSVLMRPSAIEEVRAALRAAAGDRATPSHSARFPECQG